MDTLSLPKKAFMSRMLRHVSLLLGMVGAASVADARPLAVRVADASGHPVANAVVVLRPIASAARAPAVRGPYTMSQRDLQFSPFVLIVPVGADVAFPN